MKIKDLYEQMAKIKPVKKLKPIVKLSEPAQKVKLKPSPDGKESQPNVTAGSSDSQKNPQQNGGNLPQASQLNPSKKITYKPQKIGYKPKYSRVQQS